MVADSSGDVVLNELGSMTTATLVAFKGDERLIGESAVLSASTNPLNTVDFLNLLVGKDLAGVEKQLARLPGQRVIFEADAATNTVVASVEYGADQKARFSVEQLTAMLFGKLRAQMQAKVAGEDLATARVILAVPSAWGESEKRAVRRAARVAGLPGLAIISRDAALARCFHRKHPLEPTPATSPTSSSAGDDQEQEQEEVAKHIMILDMGHTSTSAAVVKLTADGETLLASEAALDVGAEVRLASIHHFAVVV